MVKINILHITPHLGGGVGRVVLNYLSRVKENLAFTHQVACLDYANQNAVDAMTEYGLKLNDKMAGRHQQLLNLIGGADLILIHWWNHPLLYNFLVRERLPASRVILWSHVSGFSPTHVLTEKILCYPDVFVFTTPVSFDVEEVKKLSDQQKEKLRVVWTTGGVDHVKAIQPKSHAGFVVGYVGTVDYAKLHPRFLQMCRDINIPNVRFIVCGGPSSDKIKKEAESMRIANKFDFTGMVNVTDYLPLFDVFGYPLAPYHYGTGEQALAESMAAGVVPIVLSNRTERYIVKDGVTGIVAKDEGAYARAVERLHADSNLRRKLSRNARDYAVKYFSLDKMTKEWEDVFYETLNMAKTRKEWTGIVKGATVSAKDVFLEALGNNGKEFSDYCGARSAADRRGAMDEIAALNQVPIWRAETQGTVHHYNTFFPEDNLLGFWSTAMKSTESDYTKFN